MPRYIDTEPYDQLLEQREKALWEIDAIPVADAVRQCRALLAKQPTTEVAPVVHGRWIRRHNETKCSRCKFIYYSHHADYNYCPNCGATMDGKVGKKDEEM